MSPYRFRAVPVAVDEVPHRSDDRRTFPPESDHRTIPNELGRFRTISDVSPETRRKIDGTRAAQRLGMADPRCGGAHHREPAFGGKAPAIRKGMAQLRIG